MAGRFAPVEIRADVSALPARERRALATLVKAARVMDALFLRQVWAGNEAMLQTLAQEAASAAGRERLDYFLLNKGPWSRLDHNVPFIAGAPPKPDGAHFYPFDATKEDVLQWLDGLPSDRRADASGFFTTIRRDASGAFVVVPYSTEYQAELSHAAALLREAAAQTRQPTLTRYLETRAAAFLSNDYFESDVAWMELDAPIEPVIGPYEVYEDEAFNFKAAFEAFITIRDDEETQKLSSFSRHLQELENALPIDPTYRNPKVATLTPIRVVNVILTAGHANSGVQTAAFNLPNDERVIREKGTKSVMLKNVQEAKFRTVLKPISSIVLAGRERRQVSFDAFFSHILMHELMHGIGPHDILANVADRSTPPSGERLRAATTVRQALKDTYSAIEEAKADVSGLWALRYLADRGHFPAGIVRTMYTTFLASIFRSLRFGITEAHGRGVAIQLNHFLDRGAVRAERDGTFRIDETRIAGAVESLTAEIMTLQAEGSYAKAKAMIDRLGVIRPDVQRALKRLGGVPVDIAPRFTTKGLVTSAASASRPRRHPADR
jgi:Peptidase family M49